MSAGDISTDAQFERDIQFLQEQARHRALVLFIGAGVSRDAHLPDWAELLALPMQELHMHKGEFDLLDIAQFYENEKGRAHLNEHLIARLAAVQEPGAIHLALARLSAPVLFTTNFDRLMETAIERVQGVPPDVIIEDPEVGLIDDTRRTTVVKLHGCLSMPHSIVLTREEFTAYESCHPAMIAYLQGQLATRTVLFVGFSLTDPNFHAIFGAVRRALGDSHRPAFALTAQYETHMFKHWKARGIVPLVLPEFSNIPAFLKRLAQGSAPGAEAASSRQPLQAVRAALAQQLHALSPEGPDAAAPSAAGAFRRVTRLYRDADDVEPPLDTVGTGLLGAHRSQARTLLEQATALDVLQLIGDAAFWARLGRTLYLAADAEGAVHAYLFALRPEQGARASVSLSVADVISLYGDLGRATAYLGQHARAERLLRRCVFRDGSEQLYLYHTPPTRESVAARIDWDKAAARPGDIPAWVHALTQRTVAQMQRGTRESLVPPLCEARYVLEEAQDRHRRGSLDLSPHLQALYALYQGTCLRLSGGIAYTLHRPVLARSQAERARRHLRRAAVLEPEMPQPYIERMLLTRQSWLSPETYWGLIADVQGELAVLVAQHPACQTLKADLEQQYDDLRVGQPRRDISDRDA